MQVAREEYDNKPLFIRQGALKLWGVPLAVREDFCRVRHLYSFNDFFAEMCHDKETGKVLASAPLRAWNGSLPIWIK